MNQRGRGFERKPAACKIFHCHIFNNTKVKNPTLTFDVLRRSARAPLHSARGNNIEKKPTPPPKKKTLHAHRKCHFPYLFFISLYFLNAMTPFISFSIILRQRERFRLLGERERASARARGGGVIAPIRKISKEPLTSRRSSPWLPSPRSLSHPSTPS